MHVPSCFWVAYVAHEDGRLAAGLSHSTRWVICHTTTLIAIIAPVDAT